MLVETLKRRLIENEHPVGVKKKTWYKLPPQDFSYGYPVKHDKEGVSIITRHWKVHEPSGTTQPPQDFITINKLAIKMNATDYPSNKDYRSMIDIRQKPIQGRLKREIKLPPEDFAYGVPNRPSTPMKDVVNYTYSNRAEAVIRRNYDKFIQEKSKYRKGPPKVVPRYINPLVYEMRAKEEEEKKEKELIANYVDPLEEENIEPEPPLWKMRMFRDVGSKVAEEVKKFKTYRPWKKGENNLDKMIKNVQEEIMQSEGNYNNYNRMQQQQQQPIH